MKVHLKFVLIIGVSVLLLNVLMEKFRWSLLFWPLYPGILADFFIEGAHGTTPHPALGFIVELAVNMLTYILVFLGAVSMLRRSKKVMNNSGQKWWPSVAGSSHCLINAVTVHVGTGTDLSGYPTNRELRAFIFQNSQLGILRAQ